MYLIRAMAAASDPALPETAIRVDRLKLAKRLWRATADDGTEFGFDLEQPVAAGDVVLATASTRYVIRQAPEAVLTIPLDPKPEASAVLGWVVGNLHFVIEARPDRLLVPDDPALRQAFERLEIPFSASVEVFQPHRLARAVAHSHAPVSHPFIRPSR